MVVALGLAVAWVASAQSPPGRTRPGSGGDAPAAHSRPVATVGPFEIPAAEYEARTAEFDARYRQRVGAMLSGRERPSIHRQVLEVLIRQRLLLAEAMRHPDLSSVTQAEQAMQRDPAFQVQGRFEPQALAAFKSQQPAEYQRVVDALRREIAARALSDRFQR